MLLWVTLPSALTASRVVDNSSAPNRKLMLDICLHRSKPKGNLQNPLEKDYQAALAGSSLVLLRRKAEPPNVTSHQRTQKRYHHGR